MVRSIERWMYAIGVTAIGALVVIVGCAGTDDDDADAAICEEDVDDSDCEVCIKTGCCESYAACQDDADCACILACSTAGQTEAQCATSCKLTEPEMSAALTLLSGENQSCSVQCEDECVVYGFDDDDD